MNKNKKNKKKLKKIILIMILLLVVSIISMKLIINLDKEKIDMEKKYQAQLGYNEKYYEGKIFPAGIMNLKFLYENAGGKINQDVYYEKLYKFINYIIDLYPTIQTDFEIEKYYNENKKQIKENTGIKDLNNFKELINDLKNVETVENKLGVYQKSNIDLNSFIELDEACIFDTIVYYSECKEEIKIEAYFYKENSNNNDIYFKINNK